VAELAKSVPGVTAVNEVEPQMGGEDLAYYLQHVKGAFFNTGAQNPDLDATYPHHHPKFNIDEKGMLIAAKTLGVATLTYLNKNK
jgi:amidohydrolase